MRIPFLPALARLISEWMTNQQQTNNKANNGKVFDVIRETGRFGETCPFGRSHDEADLKSYSESRLKSTVHPKGITRSFLDFENSGRRLPHRSAYSANETTTESIASFLTFDRPCSAGTFITYDACLSVTLYNTWTVYFTNSTTVDVSLAGSNKTKNLFKQHNMSDPLYYSYLRFLW